MQTTLANFREVESQNAFSLQNSKLLKVELNQVTIQAKLGSMVAYQGEVRFEHAGSGGLGRMLKKAVSGEGTRGEVSSSWGGRPGPGAARCVSPRNSGGGYPGAFRQVP